MTEDIIARAIYRVLEENLKEVTDQDGRAFFRLDGFDDEVYRHLCNLFRHKMTLGGRPAIVRSTKPLGPGYEDFELEPGRTATSYRNNVPTGQALVLIFNKITADRQSLANLFVVNESLVGRQYLDDLIEATFSPSRLPLDEYDLLKKFIGTLYDIREPQLRSLVTFLSRVKAAIMNHEEMHNAIGQALPAIQLFRSSKVAALLGQGKVATTLLRKINTAANHSLHSIESKDVEKHLARLNAISFDDDHQMNAQKKRAAVEAYLRGIDTKTALEIDWSEIELLLSGRTSSTRKSKKKEFQSQLVELGKELAQALKQDKSFDVLDRDQRAVIEHLLEGLAPDPQVTEQLLEDHARQVGAKLAKKAADLLEIGKPLPTDDFPAGVTSVAIKLLGQLPEVPSGTRLKVRLMETPSNEAAAAFQTLYGGLPSLLFSIAEWDIAPLLTAATPDASEEEPEGKAQSLKFEVSVCGPEGTMGRAELEWQYKPGSSLSDLVQTVRTLRPTISQGKAPLPIFTCRTNGLMPDVTSLSRSLGSWWETQPGSVYAEWQTILATRRGLTSGAVERVAQAIEELEAAFSILLQGSSQGIFWNTEALLAAYQNLLDTVGGQLITEAEIKLATNLINRAWTIGTPDHSWLVLPLLHPMKLLWFVNRVRHFNTLLSRLLVPGEAPAVADTGWLQRDIAQRYSSGYFPAVIIYGDLETEARVFLPSDESGGAELFRPAEYPQSYIGAAASSLDGTDRAALKTAADQVFKSLESYLEAYPFASSGMEVLLANVQSPALPVEIMKKAVQSRINLSLTVHSPTQASALYTALNDWVYQNEQLRTRKEHSYFPSVRVRVQEGDLSEIVAHRRYDVVVLVDALSDTGQEVTFKRGGIKTDEPLEAFIPFFQPLLNPFAHGASRREVALTPPQLPAVVRKFYCSQAANKAPHEKTLSDNHLVEFTRILKLGNWPQMLRLLHERAVWVVCYDINADRFLLEQTADKEHLHIIRYVLGLGPKRQHNLTVSSSYRSREEVVRRMTQRLESLLDLDPSFLQDLGRSLVNSAQKLSGSVVLRAAGPGTMLNELLGLIMAKRRVENHLRSYWSDCLIAWVYLDDYRDWFRIGKRPDMLAVAARLSAKGGLELRLCVLEAKCVSQDGVEQEHTDALRQVSQGTYVLRRAFTPGKPYIDSEHWYSQLYQAIVSNLEFSNEQEYLVEALRRIQEGAYSLSMTGEAWVFGYDSFGGPDTKVWEEEPGFLYGFRVNRRGVRQTLAQLLRETRKDAPQLPEESFSQQINLPEPSQMSNITPELPALPSVAVTDTPPTADGSTPRGNHDTQELVASPASEKQERRDETSHFQAGMTVTPAAPETPAFSMLTVMNPIDLLADYDTRGDETAAQQYAQDCLDKTVRFLKGFDQRVSPAGYLVGPRVIRLKLSLMINKVSNFKNVATRKTDLKLHLRLDTEPYFQVGNDGTIWMDIPRPRPATVGLKPLLKGMGPSPTQPETRFPLGLMMDGDPFITDLRKVPHWLIGGTSGSGKSVFLRAVLLSLMLSNTPESIRFVIIDPKGDLVAFRNSPYTQEYVHTRVNLAEKAVAVLKSVKRHLDERLELMVNKHMVNEIDDFHRLEGRITLPRMVILIEEYGDLISNDDFSKELAGIVEQIAAIGRAPGFHLFICTQNPVVKTVSTDIKANCSGRVALWVKTAVNSQVILDEQGAEDLLKNGDMLFKSDGPTIRIQAPFVDNLTELHPILKHFSESYDIPQGEV